MVSGMRRDEVLQSITVKYDALAAKQIGNRLDAFVIVNFRAAPSGIGRTFIQTCCAPTVSADAPEP